jgi:hypothetical protein
MSNIVEEEIEEIKDHKILFVSLTRDAFGQDNLFIRTDKKFFCMRHSQDCCEEVHLIDGFDDLRGLVGSTIISLTKVTNKTDPIPENVYANDSHLWTFYKIATLKGFATLRWFGSSNGYYSEEVDFEEVSLSEI